MLPEQVEDLTLKCEELEEKIEELKKKILFIEGFLSVVILIILAPPLMGWLNSLLGR